MNTTHIVLDIDAEELQGAFCSYCGRAIGSTYNKEKEIYEFKCTCENAILEAELLTAVEIAQENLKNFYESTSAMRALKSSEVKRDNYKKYADILAADHEELIADIEREKLDE